MTPLPCPASAPSLVLHSWSDSFESHVYPAGLFPLPPISGIQFQCSPCVHNVLRTPAEVNNSQGYRDTFLSYTRTPGHEGKQRLKSRCICWSNHALSALPREGAILQKNLCLKALEGCCGIGRNSRGPASVLPVRSHRRGKSQLHHCTVMLPGLSPDSVGFRFLIYEECNDTNNESCIVLG